VYSLKSTKVRLHLVEHSDSILFPRDWWNCAASLKPPAQASHDTRLKCCPVIDLHSFLFPAFSQEILHIDLASWVGLARVPGYPSGTRVFFYPGNFLLPETTRVPKINFKCQLFAVLLIVEVQNCTKTKGFRWPGALLLPLFCHISNLVTNSVIMWYGTGRIV
jgi:hypothetical protein